MTARESADITAPRGAAAPPSTGEYDFPQPTFGAPPAPGMEYPSEVERYRNLVARYFRPNDVEKAMWVLYHESAGDPQYKAEGGGAGLFNHPMDGWFDRATDAGWEGGSVWEPEVNIAVAARRLYGGEGGWDLWSVTSPDQENHGEWQSLLQVGVVNGWVNPMPGTNPPTTGGFFMDPTRGTHHGIDIGYGMGLGAPIFAAAAGTLHQSRSEDGGWRVIITHSGGWQTKYAHLGAKDGSKMPWATDDGVQVAQGQLIGYMGDTGNAKAPHLHFEMIYNGQHVDPLNTGILNGTMDYASVNQMSAMGQMPQTAETRSQQARGILSATLANMSRGVRGGVASLSWDDIEVRQRQQLARAGQLGEEEVTD